MLFATPAYAQTVAPGGAFESAMTSIFPLLLLLVPFYFLILRPQSQRAKQHKAMVEALKRGDNVITSSGFVGKIAKVEENEVLIELGDNVKVRMLKAYVTEVRSKPVPVPANDKAE
jgi:preprotein translocase subunit YajC